MDIDMTADTLTKDQSIQLMQAEIERLRGALAVVTTVEGNITAADAANKAEIERLRKDFADLLRVAANDASEHQAEIERLRGELAECERVGGKFMEEIERLRKALLQIAALAEYGTTGAGKCHSDGLSAKQATSLRLAISTIAREALGE